jgi:hypothetical protein
VHGRLRRAQTDRVAPWAGFSGHLLSTNGSQRFTRSPALADTGCSSLLVEMAAQTMYAHDGALKHGAADTMAYPPQPGSPTLTNPDMILPDYDRADSPEDLSTSPILSWTNETNATLRNHMLPPESFVAGPMTPTTPIIYGNGTMLSDIGEVTEVESNAGGINGRRTSSRYSNHSLDETAVRDSPTISNALAQRLPQKNQRMRRSSIESTSTIRSAGHAPFGDFDDAVSVDDSNFQGDDEESMASSWVDDNPLQGHVAVQQPIIKRTSVSEETYTPNSLSQRAEEILANAKRRLTVSDILSGHLNEVITNPTSDDGRKPNESKELASSYIHVRWLDSIAASHAPADGIPRNFVI